MGGACSTLERDEKYIQNFGLKYEGKRSRGRHRHRWEDNVRIDLRKVEWEDVDWIHPAQGRDQLRALVNTIMNLRIQ
jgi:hypothetical protein